MKEEEILDKYGINLELFKKEQLKLAKNLDTKDIVDFYSANNFCAVDSIIVKNQIISGAVICDKDFNIVEEQYSLEKLNFPYVYGYRSFRELSSMISAFNKLQERPDIVFVKGDGIAHPRLGLASHFSLVTGIPAVGVSEYLFDEDKIFGEDILRDEKKVGKVLISKTGSSPMYVSPGDKISIASAFLLSKNLLNLPHKFPEPIHIAHKYVRAIKDELKI